MISPLICTTNSQFARSVRGFHDTLNATVLALQAAPASVLASIPLRANHRDTEKQCNRHACLGSTSNLSFAQNAHTKPLARREESRDDLMFVRAYLQERNEPAWAGLGMFAIHVRMRIPLVQTANPNRNKHVEFAYSRKTARCSASDLSII